MKGKETESVSVVAMGWGEEEGKCGVTVNGYSFFVVAVIKMSKINCGMVAQFCEYTENH